ncbi:MAG: hypothetical protein ABGX83_06555 [Nitrospira sp.]|nr:hypothetical protein [Candidatus Manganitrophaceae bacterium]HIL34315.1 hypothetical protein [Candidatus Manganitrophaceae bacterium]
MNRIILILLVFFLFSPSGIQAEIYKYTNLEGVVTLTDTLSKVPLRYRATVEVLGESDLAPLATDTFTASAERKLNRLPENLQKWFDPLRDRNILVASGLAFLLLFLISRYVGGFLFKCAFLLSGVALLGSILYSFVIPREIYLKQSLSESADSRISRKIATIQKTRELKEDIAKTENARKNIFKTIFQRSE